MSDAEYTGKGISGSAEFSSAASYNLQGTHRGVISHAGGSLWEGRNEWNALVSAYINVAMSVSQRKPSNGLFQSLSRKLHHRRKLLHATRWFPTGKSKYKAEYTPGDA
jgi:hypothetical protein